MEIEVKRRIIKVEFKILFIVYGNRK